MWYFFMGLLCITILSPSHSSDISSCTSTNCSKSIDMAINCAVSIPQDQIQHHRLCFEGALKSMNFNYFRLKNPWRKWARKAFLVFLSQRLQSNIQLNIIGPKYILEDIKRFFQKLANPPVNTFDPDETSKNIEIQSRRKFDILNAFSKATVIVDPEIQKKLQRIKFDNLSSSQREIVTAYSKGQLEDPENAVNIIYKKYGIGIYAK